jgi:tripartite-type tricarboxylate transporter receptor subunit TctC
MPMADGGWRMAEVISRVARRSSFIPHPSSFVRSIVAICIALYSAFAMAQAYPSRPIRIIVPNTPGSATDIAARIVAQRLAESVGQQTVVDNRAGASGLIGHEITLAAAPDGYTVLVSTSTSLVINPLLSKLPYDAVRDFTPISLLVISPQLLFSHPGLPAKTVDELVALARAKPGQLNCASPGFGTTNHLGCELLKTMTGINIVHVPYKGTAPAITDVAGGQVQFMFNSMPPVLPMVRAGKLRAIALGGTKRSPAAPDLPLVAETLPGFQTITWYALIGPRGLPPAIVKRLNAEVVKMYADASFAQRITDMGQEPQSSSPEELHAYMRAESTRWSQVIKTAGLTKLER